MADENPLKLPPPIIGNPFIGDIGRGQNVTSTPRRPAIPFTRWYGENEPVVVVASTDAPPRPTVVTSDGAITAPFVGYNIIKTMVVAPDWVPRPVVVGSQQLPLQQPFTLVERPPGDAVVAPTGAPGRPLIVGSTDPQSALPFTFIERQFASDVAPPKPVLVRAIELPWQPAQIFVNFSWTEPRADPAPDALVIRPADPLLAQPTVFVNRSSVEAPIPAEPTVVKAVEAPQVQPTVLVGRSPADPPVAVPAVLIEPTIIKAVEPPQAQAQVVVGRTPVDPPQPQPAVPVRPTVVAAQPAPLPVQAPQAPRTYTPPAPVVDHPTIPTIVQTPAPPAPAGWIAVNRPLADPPAVTPGTPPRPTVVTVTSVPTPGTAIVVRPVATDQPVPPGSIVVTSSRPPEVAAIVINKPWGSPPPVVRIIQPQVVTDLSLPFRPDGRARIGHGFAPALPQIFEGTIVGGRMSAYEVTGGRPGSELDGVYGTGSGYGGTVYPGDWPPGITGGQLSAEPGETYSEGGYGDEIYPGDWPEDITGESQAGAMYGVQRGTRSSGGPYGAGAYGAALYSIEITPGIIGGSR